MIQDLGDMNDEDKLAGSRLCYLRTGFWGDAGGSCLGTPLRMLPQPWEMGAPHMATAQRGVSGLAATSCGGSK